jgi:DNA-binding transcriptional LysR family regulator
VQTAVVVADSDELLARILSREVDFAVVASKPRERAFSVYPFAEDELVLIVPTKHALAKKASFSLSELCQVPLVLQSDTDGTGKVVRAAMADRGFPLDMLNVVLEVDNVEAAEVAVEAGAGAALVSRWALQRFAGRVKTLEMEEPLRQDLYLVSRHRTAQSPAQQRFVEFLESPQGKQILGLA